jgi:hypothetical protein
VLSIELVGVQCPAHLADMGGGVICLDSRVCLTGVAGLCVVMGALGKVTIVVQFWWLPTTAVVVVVVVAVGCLRGCSDDMPIG